MSIWFNFVGSKKDLAQKCIWPKKMFGSITILVKKTLGPKSLCFTSIWGWFCSLRHHPCPRPRHCRCWLGNCCCCFFKFPDGVSLFTKQEYLKDIYLSRLISSTCLYFLASLLETPNFLKFWTPGPLLVQITQFSGLRFWENKWTQIYQENVYLHSIIIIGFLLWL